MLIEFLLVACLAVCRAQHPLAVAEGDLRALERSRREDGVEEIGGTRLIDDSGKRANLFEVNGEILLIPEVQSGLNFERQRRAARGDDAGERALRDAGTFGHLLVDGWPSPIEYRRGHFGTGPPSGERTIALAEPRDACSPLAPASARGSVVIARRGGCTFGTKANRTAEAGAAALLIVNAAGEPLFHVPGPDAKGVAVSVGLISHADGYALLERSGGVGDDT